MLDRGTIERALPAAGEGPIVVALSGGGDSLALLHLLCEQVGAAKLHAIIVDHGLRPGAADDAQRALSFAHAAGVEGEIATLAWPDGPKRAQQAARVARYRALCECARRAGARVIALGHTCDDQAETLMMRAAAGTGWRGLAGMAQIAPAPVWPQGRGILAMRPLLGVRREALRACLRARQAEWLDDPANSNLAYERVRTRARLAALERGGFDPERLRALAAALRALALRIDAAAAGLVGAAVQVEGDAVRIAVEPWVAADAETRRRALAVLIAAVAGAERSPPPGALFRLDSALAAANFRGATLHGARLTPSENEVRIRRDRGAVQGRAGGGAGCAPLNLPQGEEIVWDGRLALRSPSQGWRVEADGASLLLCRDGARLRLSEWEGEARWLLATHVRHLLSPGD
ncbi:MAG: tRNA lysidine(34) synthetase TilS [Terricaulis sp.]